jgi:hypothetical protein
MQDIFNDTILPLCDMVIQRTNEADQEIMAIWTINNKENQEAHKYSKTFGHYEAGGCIRTSKDAYTR